MKCAAFKLCICANLYPAAAKQPPLRHLSIVDIVLLVINNKPKGFTDRFQYKSIFYIYRINVEIQAIITFCPVV